MINLNLNSLSGDAFKALLATVLLVAPSMIVIFLFDRELFVQLDTIKLLFLSASFTTLTVFTPFMISAATEAIPEIKKKRRRKKKPDLWLFHELLTALTFFTGAITPALLLCYFAGLSFDIFLIYVSVVWILTIYALGSTLMDAYRKR